MFIHKIYMNIINNIKYVFIHKNMCVCVYIYVYTHMGFPGGSVVKNLFAIKEIRRHGFDPWIRKIPWRRAWQPTLVFMPGESHGQRSLVGYNPQAQSWTQ